MVILEVMAHKLPIISIDEGGMLDIVGDGVEGLICEKKNPISLADCIAKLLDDMELRATLGDAGYKKSIVSLLDSALSIEWSKFCFRILLRYN